MAFTTGKAIRAKCLDCCGGQIKEVRECEIVHCSLWPFRHMHRPKKGSQEREAYENPDFFCYSPVSGVKSLICARRRKVPLLKGGKPGLTMPKREIPI